MIYFNIEECGPKNVEVLLHHPSRSLILYYTMRNLVFTLHFPAVVWLIVYNLPFHLFGFFDQILIP